MLLSQTAEYALRAMAWMVNRPPGEAVRTRDLSAATDIPSHYLSKVLRRLVVGGLLISRKGHGGGFVLARPPSEIRFIEILAATEDSPNPDRCAFGWGEAIALRAPKPTVGMVNADQAVNRHETSRVLDAYMGA